MEAVYVPYSGKFTLKVSEQELRCLKQSLEDSVVFLQNHLHEDLPATFVRATTQWVRERNKLEPILSALLDQKYDDANSCTPDNVMVVLRLKRGHSQGTAWFTSFETKKDAEKALKTLKEEGTWFQGQEDNGTTNEEVNAYLNMFANMDDHVTEHFMGTNREADCKVQEWREEDEAFEGKNLDA